MAEHRAFHIEAEGQKSCRSEVAPMAPDFAEWILAATPPAERIGKVFKLVDGKTGLPLKAHDTVGPVVAAIGRKAEVGAGRPNRWSKRTESG